MLKRHRVTGRNMPPVWRAVFLLLLSCASEGRRRGSGMVALNLHLRGGGVHTPSSSFNSPRHGGQYESERHTPDPRFRASPRRAGQYEHAPGGEELDSWPRSHHPKSMDDSTLEQSDKHYHDLLSKRAALMRQVDQATVRGLQLASRLEKERATYERAKKVVVDARLHAEKKMEIVRQKEALAAAAAAAIPPAQNDADEAAHEARLAEQEEMKLRDELAQLEADLKHVMQEGKEKNTILKTHMDEFHFLLLNAKNNANSGGS